VPLNFVGFSTTFLCGKPLPFSPLRGASFQPFVFSLGRPVLWAGGQRAMATEVPALAGRATAGLASKPWQGRPSSDKTCWDGIMRDLNPSNLQLYGSLGSQLVAKNRHFQQFTGTVLTKVGRLGMRQR